MSIPVLARPRAITSGDGPSEGRASAELSYTTPRRGRARASQIVAALVVIALAVALGWGSPRDAGDLRPSPDAVEYALTGVSLAAHGTLELRIGELVAPPRYPFGMAALSVPVLWARSIGRSAQPYDVVLVSMANGVIAAAALNAAAGRAFGLATGVLAAGLFVTSPFFTDYTRLIMAEMPSAALLCLAALALTFTLDTRRGALFGGAILGFLLAASMTLRLANAQVAPPLLMALLVAAGARRRWAALSMGVATTTGLAPLLIYQWRTYGSPLRTGYHVWIPEWVGGAHPVFAVSYAFSRPALPASAAQPNLWHYLALLVGLPAVGDGGAPVANPIHPSLAAPLCALAIVGLWAALREPQWAGRSADLAPGGRRAVALFSGAGMLSALAFYAAYNYQDVRFLMPWIPLWLLLSAAGAIRLLKLGWSRFGEMRSLGNPARGGERLILARSSPAVVGALWGLPVAAILAVWVAGLPATLAGTASWQRVIAHRSSATAPRLAQVVALAGEAPPDAWIISALDGPFLDFYTLRGSSRRYVPLARGLEFVDKPPFRAVSTAEQLHGQIVARLAAGRSVIVDRWSLEFAEGLPGYRAEMDRALADFDLLPGGAGAPHNPSYFALAPQGPDHGLGAFQLREGGALRSSDGAVYLYRDGAKRHVLSLQALNALRIKWDDVRRLPDRLIATIPEGPPVGADG